MGARYNRLSMFFFFFFSEALTENMDNSYKSQYFAYYIAKTSPCNEDPLTPHFYIVKLGFTGVYIFLIFAPKTYIMGTRVPTIYVLGKNKKNITFFHLKIIDFIAVKNCNMLYWHVFVMGVKHTVCAEKIFSSKMRKNNKSGAAYQYVYSCSLVSAFVRCLDSVTPLVFYIKTQASTLIKI